MTVAARPRPANISVSTVGMSTVRMTTLGVTACLVTALLVAGCAPSSPPDPGTTAAPFGLLPDLLPATTVTSDMAIISGENRTALGTARREMLRTTLGGADAIRFVLVQELRQGTMYDTLWVDAATLLPIQYVNDFGAMQTIRMSYGDDGHVVSVVTRGDVVTGVDTVLTTPHLDLAEFSMLIPALPLADGYATELPVFHYENGATNTTVRVIGSDKIDYHDEARDVWIVEYGTAPATSRHFVDKDTRDVLRVEAAAGPDRRFEQVAQ